MMLYQSCSLSMSSRFKYPENFDIQEVKKPIIYVVNKDTTYYAAWLMTEIHIQQIGWHHLSVNGILKEKYFVSRNGKNGPYLKYYNNGSVKAVGFYTNDVADGNWVYFDTTGCIVSDKLKQPIK